MKSMVTMRVAVVTAALFFLSSPPRARAALYGAYPLGNKVRIEGTSTIHDWTVEGTIIAGSMDLPADFPLDASKPMPASLSATPKVTVSIPITSLHNLKNYEGMDDIMNAKLLIDKHPRISYSLTEIKPVKAEAGKLNFDTKGDLVVAGVTNNIAMPVVFEKVADNKLKVTGTVKTKMTNFKIEPPNPVPLIKAGDDITLSFEWQTVLKAAPAAK